MMAHYYIYFEFGGIFVVFLGATLAAIAVRDMYVKDARLAIASHMTQASDVIEPCAKAAIVSSLQNNTFLWTLKAKDPWGHRSDVPPLKSLTALRWCASPIGGLYDKEEGIPSHYRPHNELHFKYIPDYRTIDKPPIYNNLKLIFFLHRIIYITDAKLYDIYENSAMCSHGR
jgi:hypothetical protein